MRNKGTWTKLSWDDGAKKLTISAAPPAGATNESTASREFRVELLPAGTVKTVTYNGILTSSAAGSAPFDFTVTPSQDTSVPIKVYARDTIGNEGTGTFDFRIFPKKFRSSRIEVDDAFLSGLHARVAFGAVEGWVVCQPAHQLTPTAAFPNPIERLAVDEVIVASLVLAWARRASLSVHAHWKIGRGLRPSRTSRRAPAGTSSRARKPPPSSSSSLSRHRPSGFRSRPGCSRRAVPMSCSSGKARDRA